MLGAIDIELSEVIDNAELFQTRCLLVNIGRFENERRIGTKV